jgi:hypothetical protein
MRMKEENLEKEYNSRTNKFYNFKKHNKEKKDENLK